MIFYGGGVLQLPTTKSADGAWYWLLNNDLIKKASLFFF
jgi:hypothetical protein